MNKIDKIITALEQSLLSQYGLLLRGGIAVGKPYQDNEVVYGPGLVKAYALESKYAVYPRVIMLPSDFERVILSCSESSKQINHVIRSCKSIKSHKYILFVLRIV